jgi:hypothetical protein
VGLTTYQTQVQRLLHDTSTNFWPLAELTDYINEARNRVAQDTKCLRQLVTGVTLPSVVELYNPLTFLPASIGPLVIDVMAITVYWGNTRRKLMYKPFTEFDAFYRYWNQLQTIPEAYTRMSPTIIYIGPTPDQAYTSDWEVSVNPTPLIDNTTVDQIPIPFTEPVQYYAAYKAKWKEQSIGEAELFRKQYTQNLLMCARSWMTRIVPSPYSR